MPDARWTFAARFFECDVLHPRFYLVGHLGLFYFANGLKMTSTPPSDTPLNDYTQLGNKCKTNSPLNTKPTPSIATIATDAFL